MKLVHVAVVSAPIGAVFGAATSLSNAIAVPFKIEDGSTTGDPIWAQAGEILSLIVDSGWAWATLAILLGWLAAARSRPAAGRWPPAAAGALAGTCGLACATVAYFAVDSGLRSEAFGLGQMRIWLVATLVFGPVLGAIGSQIGRPGVAGLLAGLTAPIGAAGQIIMIPSSPLVPPQRAEIVARVIVWGLAALVAGLVIIRFVVKRAPRNVSS